MTPRDWAREKVEQLPANARHNTGLIWKHEAIKLLLAERAQAKRVVRDCKQNYRFEGKRTAEFIRGFHAACDEMIRRLK